MSKKLYLVLFCVLGAFSQVKSQISNIKFKTLATTDGLSQSNVNFIAQDHTGFMWFTTKDGINKYDGYNFIVYKRSFKDKNSVSSNDVKIIAEDYKGNLWINTATGNLDIFDINKDKFVKHNYGFIKNVQFIYHDRLNNAWIGTRDSGLYKINKSRDKINNYRHHKTNSICSNSISYITEDRSGNIWIGTSDKGISVLNPKKNYFINFQSNPKPNSLTHNFIKFIFEDNKGKIWIGTYGGGLNLFDGKLNDFSAVKQDSPFKTGIVKQRYLLSMAEDKSGQLWIGTENDGLCIYDPLKNTSTSYKHADNDNNGISSNTINVVFKDRADNMWMGTSNAGLCIVKADAARFAHFKNTASNNSLSNNIVKCFFEDSDKKIWIGTDGGGLSQFNETTNSFKTLRHIPKNKNSVCSDYILTISEDSHKNLWIGSWGNGISLLNDGKWQHFKNIPGDTSSLSNNYALYIIKDSKNRIWVGTYGGGLNLFDKKSHTFKRYQHNEKDPNSISSDYILVLAEDRKGNLWIGTDGSGLNRFDEKNQKFVSDIYRSEKAGLSNQRINAIFEDNSGYLWLGTNFGLNKFNPATLKNQVFFSENGLANDLINAIVGDNEGSIWVSTNKGISQINLKNNRIKNYNTEDGLQDDEFNTGKLLSSSGRIYFGGKNGFNSFFPSAIKSKKGDVSVVFTNLQVFNKTVAVSSSIKGVTPLKQTISQAKEIIIPYSVSVFSFEFATLNYAAKGKNQYSYYLEGFDDQWHNLGTKNSVTFTNLDPKTYTLKIRALKSDGNWSRNYSEIKIIITPPFWKTWWFICLEVLLVAIIILTIFYLRVASIKARNRQLKKEVAVRTHELSEINSVLLESNERIQIQNITLEESNKEVQRKTEKILVQQKQIVLQNEKLVSTVNELKNSNKSKDKLFSIIAHDLRNPVAALSGLTQTLSKKIESLNPTEIASYTKNINDSSSSINTLVNNLMDWARTQSENIAYEPTDVNVHELLMQNVFIIEAQLRNKNISCVVDSDVSHYLLGDKNLVDTIVRNLLGNAVKFTNLNGKIAITSGETDEEIFIKFADTGIGMTEEEIKGINEHNSSSISYGTLGESGTRLGLHIVKEFIDINKGRITIESELDKGSVFTVYFPKTSSTIDAATMHYEFEAEKISIQPEEEALLKGKRILIVDDNEELRNFLKLLLSDTLEIFEAKNGKDALEIAKDTQPDIIITDMVMPVMNGLEFCNQIKSNANTSHIPVVLLTGNTEEEGQIAAYDSGADSFLTKPLNQKVIFRVLLNLISNQENIKRRFAVSDELFPKDLNYNKLDEEFIETVSNYIEEHISETDLDYKKLCELTAMSRTVLYAKFKTLTGLGVHDFIKNIRLKKSLELLAIGKLNISQVAYEVGFATPSYFSKSFAKQYQIGPKEYVLKIKKNTNKNRK